MHPVERFPGLQFKPNYVSCRTKIKIWNRILVIALFFFFKLRMGRDIAIPKSYQKPILLASFDPMGCLESTAAASRTKEQAEKI